MSIDKFGHFSNDRDFSKPINGNDLAKLYVDDKMNEAK